MQTKLNLAELRAFENELEQFEESIKKRCATMNLGIDGSSQFMKDEKCQQCLRDARTKIEDILKCLSPVETELERVRKMIKIMTDEEIGGRQR